MKGILGGANPQNAEAQLEAGMITKAEYEQIKKDSKSKKKKDKKKSLFDLLKGD
jgi:uncharacterized membrane protein